MNNIVFYIVVFVVIAHFLAGIIFLVLKLSGPVAEEALDDQSIQAEEASLSEGKTE